MCARELSFKIKLAHENQSFYWFLLCINGFIGSAREFKTLYSYIYIFIAIALDETSILVAVYFSMQNNNQSCDLGRSLWRRFTSKLSWSSSSVTSTSANNVLCLLTFAWRWSRITMTLSAGVPPPSCSETSARYDLILNIRRIGPVRCLITTDI